MFPFSPWLSYHGIVLDIYNVISIPSLPVIPPQVPYLRDIFGGPGGPVIPPKTFGVWKPRVC